MKWVLAVASVVGTVFIVLSIVLLYLMHDIFRRDGGRFRLGTGMSRLPGDK